MSGSRPSLSDMHNGILGEGRPHLQGRTFLNSTLKPLLKISSGGGGGDTGLVTAGGGISPLVGVKGGRTGKLGA